MLPARMLMLLPLAVILSACGSASAPEQTQANAREVYVNPETGELQVPPPGAPELPRVERRVQGENEHRMVESPDGTRFLIHDRDDWTKLEAEQHSDSELKIKESR